jgi:hypothetical protein
VHVLSGKNPAFGPPHWVCGAIGCAQWTGVRMRDVLRASGMDVDGERPRLESLLIGFYV